VSDVERERLRDAVIAASRRVAEIATWTMGPTYKQEMPIAAIDVLNALNKLDAHERRGSK
jgi:hypothetical protein